MAEAHPHLLQWLLHVTLLGCQLLLLWLVLLLLLLVVVEHRLGMRQRARGGVGRSGAGHPGVPCWCHHVARLLLGRGSLQQDGGGGVHGSVGRRVTAVAQRLVGGQAHVAELSSQILLLWVVRGQKGHPSGHAFREGGGA